MATSDSVKFLSYNDPWFIPSYFSPGITSCQTLISVVNPKYTIKEPKIQLKLIEAFCQYTVLEKITSHNSDDTIKYIHRNLLRYKRALFSRPVLSCFNKPDNIFCDQLIFSCDCVDTTMRMISENKHYIRNYMELMWTMIIIFSIAYLFFCVVFSSIFRIV